MTMGQCSRMRAGEVGHGNRNYEPAPQLTYRGGPLMKQLGPYTVQLEWSNAASSCV